MIKIRNKIYWLSNNGISPLEDIYSEETALIFMAAEKMEIPLMYFLSSELYFESQL